MNVVVAGGTGLIGVPLCKALLRAGHTVHVLTRSADKAGRRLPAECHIEEWDGQSRGPWEAVVAGAHAVVNLAGENIAAAPWSKVQRARIVESRVSATQALVRAFGERGSGQKAPLFISASGKDYYGDQGDRLLDESAPPGESFLASTCTAWEEAAKEGEGHGVNVVLLRLGMVLAKGGALSKMQLPFKFYVGGAIGSGRQWVSWIHRADVIRLILHIIDRHRTENAPSGAINAVAPGAVTMREFCRTLGRVMRRPSWLRVPAAALRFTLGEMADLMLHSQRVMPRRAIELGYQFQFPTLQPALEDLFGGERS